jgi:hypothetical protein
MVPLAMHSSPPQVMVISSEDDNDDSVSNNIPHGDSGSHIIQEHAPELPDHYSSPKEMSVDPPSEEAFHEPYLETLGIAINTHLSVLVCLSCQKALLSSALSTHMDAQHREARLKVDENKVAFIVNQYHVKDVLAPVPNFSHPPFFGLKQQTGYVCDSCGHCFTTPKLMRRHFVTEHEKIKASWKDATLQQYHSGHGGKTFWACEETSSLASAPAKIAHLIQSSKDDLAHLLAPKQYQVNARNLGPWILTTKWNELVDGLDTELLRSWVAPPNKETWERALQPFVLKWMERALVAPMEELDLMRLNTPIPQTG